MSRLLRVDESRVCLAFKLVDTTMRLNEIQSSVEIVEASSLVKRDSVKESIGPKEV